MRRAVVAALAAFFFFGVLACSVGSKRSAPLHFRSYAACLETRDTGRVLHDIGEVKFEYDNPITGKHTTQFYSTYWQRVIEINEADFGRDGTYYRLTRFCTALGAARGMFTAEDRQPPSTPQEPPR